MSTVTMTSPPANGRARRSLNDSITQLDQMVDGLSEAIPETIRDTLAEVAPKAIAEGVRAAVLQVLTDPVLTATLRGPGPKTADRPTLRERLAAAVQKSRAAAARWGRLVAGKFAGMAVTLGATLYARRTSLGLVWRARKPLLVALGVGAVAAVLTVTAPGWVAATVSGICGTCTTLAVQGWLLVRKGFGLLNVTS